MDSSGTWYSSSSTSINHYTHVRTTFGDAHTHTHTIAKVGVRCRKIKN